MYMGLGLRSMIALGMVPDPTQLFSTAELPFWTRGDALTLGTTPLAAGSAPPVVTLSGTRTFAVGLRIEIQSPTTFRYAADWNGSAATWIESGVAIPAGSTYPASGAISGLVFNFPAGTYASGQAYVGRCETMSDKTAHGRNFTQATVANQFKVTARLLNGRAGIEAVDANSVLLCSPTYLRAPPGTTSFMRWAIFRMNTRTQFRIAVGEVGGATGLIYTQSVSQDITQFNTTNANTTPMANGVFKAVSAYFGNTTADKLAVGAAFTAGIVSAGNATGANPEIGQAAACLDMSLLEQGELSGVLSTDPRLALLKNYWADYYATSVNA